VTVLGIETSCDETSAAVLRDGILLSNLISSQLFHSEYGGVVPELASRAHQRIIVPIVDEALSEAGIRKTELDAVAVTYGPGLVGSILVGLNFAKGMALALRIPLVGVNHIEAHMYSNFLEEPKPLFPFVCLIVSGGHTQLVLVKKPFDYRLLGRTRDDAAGEAFDKVAKMLGLGYPGGPIIDELAKEGDPKFVKFPRSYIDDSTFDFSFSGLKTSVLYYLKSIGKLQEANVRKLLSSEKKSRGSDKKTESETKEHPGENSGPMDRQLLSNICASFQSAVIDVLVDKTMASAQRNQARDVSIAGGVSANSYLRAQMRARAREKGLRVFIPKLAYCTDNAAMIALLGWMKLKEGKVSNLELGAAANLEIQ
jgi:N6-L-threonylcarbamoyladenine synthase